MSDYRAIVENIRSFLASDYQIRSDEVVAWSETYARLCREANDRLQRCAESLKKRLRAEAIQYAEEAPNLLDMVAALDFPELPDWKQACFRFDLPDAPPLMMDAAAMLNDAYGQEQPVEGLMAQHRLLALARAPLKTRLSVMRKIDEREGTASVLADDIRLFEGLRLEEIRSSIGSLVKSRNLDGVRQLQSELGETWQRDVPADLRTMVDNFAGKFHQISAEAEIRALMPALNNAYSAMSEEEARAILGQILAIGTGARLTMPGDLQDQIDPISAWLNEAQEQRQQQAQFEEACRILQQAIDTGAPLQKLERAYRDVVRFQRDIPQELEVRYQQAIEQRIRAARLKRFLIVGSIAAGFLLIAGIAAATILQVMRSNEIQDVTTLIDQARGDIDGGDLARERQVVKQVLAQHARIANAAAVIRAASDFQATADAEQHREEEFKRMMGLVLASGIQSPDTKALEGASQIAKTPDEQHAVTDLRTKIGEYAQEQQSKIDEQFTVDAAELGKEITAQLDPAASTGPKATLTKIDALTKRVRELQERANVSAALRQAQSLPLLAILTQKREAAQEAASLADLMQRVEQVKTIEEQSAALTAVLDKAGDSPFKSDFQHALDLAPQAHAVEEWGKLTAAWTQPLPTTYADAASRVREIQKYLDANPDGPLDQPIKDYLTYVNLGLVVAAPDGPWKKSYHDLLVNPLVHDLHIVMSSDGKSFYTLGKPTIVTHSTNGQPVSQTFKAVTSSDVTQQKTIELHAPMLLKVQDAPSPQAIYAEASLKQLESFDFAGWDSIGSQFQDGLLKAKQMDPILRAILIHNLLVLNEGVAEYTRDMDSRKVMDGLAGKNVDDVEWVNPDNPPSSALVTEVDNLISQLPKREKSDVIVKAHRDKLLTALPMNLMPAGVILKTGGHISVLIEDPHPVVAYAIDISKKLLPVAQHGPGGWNADPAAVAEVPSGSLLFVSGAAK